MPTDCYHTPPTIARGPGDLFAELDATGVGFMPPGAAVWVTHTAFDPVMCAPLGSYGELARIFEAPNGTSEHGPVLLAKTKPGPRGYKPQLGDIEQVFAIVLHVETPSGDPVEVIEHPDQVAERLPYEAIIYTAPRHTPERPRLTVVMPLARPHTLEQAYAVREYLRECVWSSDSVRYPEFDVPVLPPQGTAGEFFDGWAWRTVVSGPRLSADDIHPDYVPLSEFPLPLATDSKKLQQRRERATKAVALLPVVLELFRKSDLYQWYRSNPIRLCGVQQQLASLIAPLVQDTRAAGRDEYESARDLAEAALLEICPPGEGPSGWPSLVHDALTEALAIPGICPARWPEFWSRGVPAYVGGLTSTPLDDLRTQVARGKLDPADWVFVGSTGTWHPRLKSGRFDPKGLSQQSVTTLLRKHLAVGKNDEGVKSFLDKAVQVHKREAVFTTTLEVAEHDGVPILNLYRATSVVPRRGACPNIELLLRNVVGDERTDKAVEYLKDWIAGMLQALRRGETHKWLTYIILIGRPGSGKSLLVRVLGLLLGRDNVVVIDQKRLESTYTPVLPNTLLLVGNEVHASSFSEDDVANHIKRIVTDDTLMVERKYCDAGEVANVLNLMLLTNNKKPLKLEPDDRRATVLMSRKRLPKTVAAAVVTDLEGTQEELSAFYDQMLRRRVGIDIDELFETEARKNLIAAGQTKLDTFVDLLKSDGFLAAFEAYKNAANTAGNCDRAATVRHKDAKGNEREYILSDTLLAVAQFHCPAARGREVTAKALALALEEGLPGARPGDRIRPGAAPNPLRTWSGIPLVVDDSGSVLRESGALVDDAARPKSSAAASARVE